LLALTVVAGVVRYSGPNVAIIIIATTIISTTHCFL
jgi:hypothetical protein